MNSDEKLSEKYLLPMLKLFGSLIMLLLLLTFVLLIIIPKKTGCDDFGFIDIKNYEDCISVSFNITLNGTYVPIDIIDCNGTVVELYLEEQIFLLQNEMKIFNSNDEIVGKYTKNTQEDNSVFYSYKYVELQTEKDYTVATISEASLINTNIYTFKKCSNLDIELEKVYDYRIEEKMDKDNNINYILFNNETLIAQSREAHIPSCSESILLINEQNSIVALLNQGCSNSLLRDDWYIVNFNTTVVDTYVIGFIGFIKTLG